MNPLTMLLLALSTWIAVLSVNDVWFSLSIVVVSLIAAWRRLPVLLGLCLPMFASLAIIHVPSGHWDLALSLGMRGCALIASLLAASAYIRISDLAKALQSLGVNQRLTYVLGTALNLLPMGRRYASAYSFYGQSVLGRVRYVIFPLITRMLVHSTGRQLPLETAGVLLPGKRTVLRPVPFRAIDWAVCGLSVVGALASVVG